MSHATFTVEEAREIAQEVAPHCAGWLNYTKLIAEAVYWNPENPAEQFRRDLEQEVAEADADCRAEASMGMRD